MGDDYHGRPTRQFLVYAQYFRDQLGSSAEVTSAKSIISGFVARARAIATRLLSAERLLQEGLSLVGQAYCGRQVAGDLFRLGFGLLLHLSGAIMMFCITHNVSFCHDGVRCVEHLKANPRRRWVIGLRRRYTSRPTMNPRERITDSLSPQAGGGSIAIEALFCEETAEALFGAPCVRICVWCMRAKKLARCAGCAVAGCSLLPTRGGDHNQ